MTKAAYRRKSLFGAYASRGLESIMVEWRQQAAGEAAGNSQFEIQAGHRTNSRWSEY